MVHFLFATVHRHWYHTHQRLCEVSKNRRGCYCRMSVYIVSNTIYFDLCHSIIWHNQSRDTVSNGNYIKTYIKDCKIFEKFIIARSHSYRRGHPLSINNHITLLIFYRFLEDHSTSYEFRNFNRTFYMRGIPFYAGLLAGIIVEELKKKEIKPSKVIFYSIAEKKVTIITL